MVDAISRSNLEHLDLISGDEIIVVNLRGVNYTMYASALLALINELDRGSVGLENVDNTSDIDKPVSLATGQILNGILNRISNIDNTSDVNKPISQAVLQTFQSILNRLTNVDNTHDVDKPVSTAANLKFTEITDRLTNVDNTHDADKPISSAMQSALDNISSSISEVDNTSDMNKPISYDAIQVFQAILDRISNVDNTRDADKPVSNSTQQSLNLKQNSLNFTPENTTNKAQPNGYASLDSTGKVPAQQIPSAVLPISIHPFLFLGA